jgi:hypothetical protein
MTLAVAAMVIVATWGARLIYPRICGTGEAVLKTADAAVFLDRHRARPDLGNTATPEPATLGLLMAGLGVAWARAGRRRSKRV